MYKLLIAGLSGFLLAGCKTDDIPSAGTQNSSVQKPFLTGDACPEPSGGAYLFWMDPPSREVGDKVSLTPYFSTHPGAFEPLPAGCVGTLASIPEDALTFERTEDGQV